MAGGGGDAGAACSEVSEGRQSAPDLLGQHWVRPLKVETAWYTPLTPSKIHAAERSALLERYRQRVDLNDLAREPAATRAGDPAERL